MSSPRLLISGDYWHADFRDLVARLSVPATLTPLDQIAKLDTRRFSLVVIAQSRSKQIDQSLIDDITTRNPLTPVVMLLGSWCEGERRSDQPITGVKRVFWHQWQGRFDQFCRQTQQQGISLWHAPAIESDADRVKAIQETIGLKNEPVVGISALNQTSFDTLSHAITAMGGIPKWVERTSTINLSASAAVICIDADSADEGLDRRIHWVRRQVDHAPLIILLNFPRRQEIEKLRKSGVTTVLSKPFELGALHHAIQTSIGFEAPPADQILRGPSFTKNGLSTKTAE